MFQKPISLHNNREKMPRFSFLSFLLTSFCIGCFVAPQVLAQEGDVEITTHQYSLGDETIGGSLQPGGPKNLIALLEDKRICDQLDLIDEQMERFRAVKEAYSLQVNVLGQSMAIGPGTSAEEKLAYMRKMSQLKKDARAEIRSMLLPHQIERLKEITLQIYVKRNGAANTILSEVMVEELEISSSQKKRIESLRKELKEELEEQIAKLKETYENKLLDELTDKQKTRLEELSGDSFEYRKEPVAQSLGSRSNGE
jgi:hypothetical protein